jgi:hypothetical protein
VDAARDDHSALLLAAIRQKTGFAKRYEVRLVAKSFTIDNVPLDGPDTDIISHSDMVWSFLWLSFRSRRRGIWREPKFPASLSISSPMPDRRARDSRIWAVRCCAVIGLFWRYERVLESHQHFRRAACINRGFAASARGRAPQRARRSPPRTSRAEGYICSRRMI